MPRRRRPPATARDIGAYLAGTRLCALWLDERPGEPTREAIIERLAREDAAIYASMPEARWWAMFDMGWAARFTQDVTG